ncbi:PiggyBac transposable element-derived protein 4 [Cucumispora dikerogammari]|nr:PiggyBac transposable element-derived protein 4 [Cucumispora dikerogammari]
MKNKEIYIEKTTNKIISYLNGLFSAIYDLNEELSIDKGMCKFQGRYSFKTYNSAKPIKAGTKFFILAVSKTLFVCKILLYTGKTVRIKDTVKCLMENFTNKNHKLFMDNFYNSFDLCVEIK